MTTYTHLNQYPTSFLNMTGLRISEFDVVLQGMLPRVAATEEKRLTIGTTQFVASGGDIVDGHVVVSVSDPRGIGFPVRNYPAHSGSLL